MKSLKALTFLAATVLVVAAFSFVGPEGAAEESNPAVIPVDVSFPPAMVVNFGRDDNTCMLLVGPPPGILVGEGRSTEVFIGNRFNLHCNGVFFSPPPGVIRAPVGCPGGVTGSIVITPGGTFAARCNGAV